MENEERITFVKDLRLYILLSLGGLILLILLLGERSDLTDTQRRFDTFKGRLLEARQVVGKHRDVLLPSTTAVTNPGLLAEKSLLTVVKEATEKVGIAGQLEAVNPGTDPKRGVLKARVTLRNVTVDNYVDFMLHLKGLSAGIEDVNATMGMIGYGFDRWRIVLVLEAPPGVAQRPGGKTTGKKGEDAGQKG